MAVLPTKPYYSLSSHVQHTAIDINDNSIVLGPKSPHNGNNCLPGLPTVCPGMS